MFLLCFSFSTLSYSEKLLTTFCISSSLLACSFFCEKGTGQNRQGAGSILPVCICIKKLIDGAGLLKCKPSGNRLFGKVDDGFQSLTTHSVQQVYCLQECGFKESNNVILLWKDSFVCTFITLPFSVNGSTFMKHCVALPALSFILFYVFSFFLFIDNHYLCTRLWGSWS